MNSPLCLLPQRHVWSCHLTPVFLQGKIPDSSRAVQDVPALCCACGQHGSLPRAPVLTRPPAYARHSSYLIYTVLPWPIYLPVKKKYLVCIRSKLKGSWYLITFSWDTSVGTGCKGWRQGAPACQLTRAPNDSLATPESRFSPGKSWCYNILLLLMLLTPEPCCSTTVSTVTVQVFLNSYCSLKVLLPAELPVAPCSTLGSAEWQTSHVHFWKQFWTACREVSLWLESSTVPAITFSGALFLYF